MTKEWKEAEMANMDFSDGTNQIELNSTYFLDARITWES